ncbi:hypothetical protein BST61_g2726 [Cercospora zeina]
MLEVMYREESAVDNRLQESARARSESAVQARSSKTLSHNNGVPKPQRDVQLTAEQCSVLLRGRQEALRRGVDSLVYTQSLVPQPPASLPQFDLPMHAREMLEAYYTKYDWPNVLEEVMLRRALGIEADDVTEFYDTVIQEVKDQEAASSMLMKKRNQECARLCR